MIARIFWAFLLLGLIVWAVRLAVIAAIVLVLAVFAVKPMETVLAILTLLFLGLIITQPLIGIPLLLVLLTINSVISQKA